MSVILRPDLAGLPYLVMAASLAAAYSIESATGVKTQLKWPNDVLIDGKKVGGILIENEIKENRVAFSIIGIGINTGELVAGYIGSTRTMSYSVIGDTVNTASRLCSAAKAGEIIISEATHRLVRNDFDTIALDPVKAKGKSKPVEVFKVIEEASDQPYTTLDLDNDTSTRKI